MKRIYRLATILSVFLVVFSLAGGATTVAASGPAQTDGVDLTDNWCVELSPIADDTITLENGTVVDGCLGSIDQHNNVSVDFYRTSPSIVDNDNQTPVYFISDISSNARDASTVDISYRRNGEEFASRTVNLGENQRTSLSVSDTVSSDGGVELSGYQIVVSVTNEDQEVIADRTINVGSFYINPDQSADTGTSDGAENEADDEVGINGQISVTPNTSDVNIQGVQTDPSRYNDETIIRSELQDTSIPPLEQDPQEGEFRNSGVGELKDFGELRQNEGSLNSDATISSVGIGGQQQLNFGTAFYGVPEAQNHTFVLSYAMQTASPTSEGVGVEIVDRQGNIIDPQQDIDSPTVDERRLLSDTVITSYGGEQFEGAADDPQANDDALSTNTVQFELTEEEIEYINDNFEAYAVFRTKDGGSPGGLTIFKPNRMYITSSDSTSLQFDVEPQAPQETEEIQLTVEEYPAEQLYGTVVERDENGNITSETQEAADFTWQVRNADTGDLAFEVDGPNPSVTQLQNREELTSSLSINSQGTYQITLIADPPTETQFRSSQSVRVYDPDSVSSTSGTFDISYRVNNRLNSEYGTYDVAPVSENLRLEVTVRNRGNSEVRREVSVLDTKSGEFGYTDRVKETQTISVSPQSQNTVQFDIGWEPHEFGEHTITVVDNTALENGNDPEVVREQTGGTETTAYVLQPATLEINEISAPPEHYIYDNFNTSVEIVNTGDLSTNHPASQGLEVEGTFANDWETIVAANQLDLDGGEVRDNTDGTYQRIQFNRTSPQFPNGLDYVPETPTTTEQQRNDVDSPYGTSVGPNSLQFRTIHTWADGNQAIQDSLDATDDRVVELYKFDIISLEVEDGDGTDLQPRNTSSPPAVFASPFPFTEDHYTNDVALQSDRYSTYQDDRTYDATGVPQNRTVLPTTGIEQAYPVANGDLNNNFVGSGYGTAVVTVRNDGTAQTGSGRVVVRAKDRDGNYIDVKHTQYQEQLLNGQAEWWDSLENSNSIVAVGSERLDAFETTQVEMPIIVPNKPSLANEDVVLEATPRNSTDYSQQFSGVEYASPNEYIVEVLGYGDALYYQKVIDQTDAEDGDNYDAAIDQLCESTYGDHPDPLGLGQCNNDGNTDINVDFTYNNVGSNDVTDQQQNLHYFMNDPTDMANQPLELSDHYIDEYQERSSSQNTLTTDDEDGQFRKAPEDYWAGNGEYNVPALDTDTYTFQNQFIEPGLYSLHVTDHRVIDNPDEQNNFPDDFEVSGEDGIDYNRDYEDQDHLQSEGQVNVMVWDTTNPVARAHAFDCTSGGGYSQFNVSLSQCYPSEYNGLSSLVNPDSWDAPSTGTTSSSEYDIHEGGAIHIEGEQITTLTPEQAESAQISSDNVGVSQEDYNWNIEGEQIRYTLDGTIKHRFDEPGTYTVTLTVSDMPEFVEDGQNSDTATLQINVKEDNDDPYVNVREDGYSQSYDVANDKRWVGSPADRGGEFIEQDWTVSTSDSQIGVECNGQQSQCGWEITSPSGNTGQFTLQENEDIDGFTQFDATQIWPTRHTETGGVSPVQETATVKFTTTDFAGNTASDTASVQIYEDNTDPTAEYSADKDWVWASNDSNNYDGGTVSFDAGASSDNGSPPVGLHDNAYNHSLSNGWSTEDTFSTTYGMGSQSETKYESVTVRDWYGNDSETIEDSVIVRTDIDDPVKDRCSAGSPDNGEDCYDEDIDVDGEPTNTDYDDHPGDWENSADAEACIVIDEDGYNGGVGIYDVSASGDGNIQYQNDGSTEVCVSASADPNANADDVNANASKPSCDADPNTDTAFDDDYDSEDETASSTVTVEDYHGNSESWTIEAYAEADAYEANTDSDTEYSDPCPPPPPPPPPPDPPQPTPGPPPGCTSSTCF